MYYFMKKQDYAYWLLRIRILYIVVNLRNNLYDLLKNTFYRQIHILLYVQNACAFNYLLTL